MDSNHCRFEESIEFALGCLQKASLQLSSYQKDALKSILSVRDTFICLPTGHGKSIIFECLPYCCDSLCSDSAPSSEQVKPSSVLVVSPLISLMNSQVDELHKRN